MCGPRGFSFGSWPVQMEPPISDWFRSLPYAIDSLANSVKVGLIVVKKRTCYSLVLQFQQATMGSLLKYYREKINKQRSIIEQLKKDRAELTVLRRCGRGGHILPPHSTDCSVSMSSFNRRMNICAANLNIPTIATLGTQPGLQNGRGSAITGESDQWVLPFCHNKIPADNRCRVHEG